MSSSAHKRPFTAEIRKTGAASSPRLTPSAASEAVGKAEARHHELMQAISEIVRRLDATLPPAEQPSHPCAEETPPADTGIDLRDSSASPTLLIELRALKNAIAETKREIAALRAMGEPPASLATATNELDAVVQATESATECILAASERIDTLVIGLRNQAADPDERSALDEIGEQVTRIFESCNFQDITGQRITKVVNAMKFIEQRVERMIDILGGTQAFEDLAPVAPPPPQHAAADEADLLCGPQLDKNKISQDDIDAFFN
jgi:chemotaxis protein CheZ